MYIEHNNEKLELHKQERNFNYKMLSSNKHYLMIMYVHCRFK